jgi:type I restriction enzyme S subunit
MIANAFYKENEIIDTPVGSIPQDWDVVRLDRVAKLIMGQSPPSSTYNKEGEGVPFLQGKMEFGDIYPNPVIYCSSPLRLAEQNDVLMSVRAPVGDVNLAPYKVCIGRGLAAIRFDQKPANHIFYFYVLQLLKKTIERLGKGSTFKALVKADLETLNVPLPPYKEQQRVAEILSAVERGVQKTNDIIATTERLKKGLMQQLLTNGIRHEEFVTSKELGLQLPKDWDVARLGDVCEKTTVGIVIRPASYYVPDGVPALRSLNIKEDRIDLHDLVFISENDNNSKLAKSRLREGDVVIVRTGYPGTACVIPKELDGVNCIDLVIARPKRNRIESNFLSRVLNSPIGRKQCLAVQTGLAQKHFNIGAVKKIWIPLPPLEEQQRITKILTTIDKKLNLERSEKVKLEKAKQGLMDLLLTGKIRIRVD